LEVFLSKSNNDTGEKLNIKKDIVLNPARKKTTSLVGTFAGKFLPPKIKRTVNLTRTTGLRKATFSPNPKKRLPTAGPYRKINAKPDYIQPVNSILSRIPSLKIIFLGGLNQIGKNMTAFECGNDIIIVDCGTAFPDGEMLGIDLVIPDFTYLEENRDKIRGLIVTHGHEDHIGAIPYFLKKLNVPIYGASLTIGLITAKLKEHRLLGGAKLNPVSAGQRFVLGCFDVEFIHINHSIPDAVALAIRAPAGIVVHTGDFKIDCTPARGEMIDLARFSELGREGVLVLMADSTNADRPGYTATEKSINESFERLFRKARDRRIIIATFASNIGRIQQIMECAAKYDRKIMLSGRSMVNYVSIAIELKRLIVPEKIMIDIDEMNKYLSHEIVLITTGSQGEPMSALYRMAFAEHIKIDVGENDFIIISANPIPGNEKMVGSVVNELMRLGCEVIYESMYEVHVSGHACQEELKIIHGLTRPQFFIPIHGERKHLKKHAELAKNMGMSENSIYIGETGDIVEVNSTGIKRTGRAPAEPILIDGIGVGDVGSIVLKDRKHLGQDGLIVMVAALNLKEKRIMSGPDIVSRGFVYVKESEELMTGARRTAARSILNCFEQNTFGNILRTRVRDDLYRYFHDRTRRNPVILPIIMEIKQNQEKT
jgi:ribonuclease J